MVISSVIAPPDGHVGAHVIDAGLDALQNFNPVLFPLLLILRDELDQFRLDRVLLQANCQVTGRLLRVLLSKALLSADVEGEPGTRLRDVVDVDVGDGLDAGVVEPPGFVGRVQRVGVVGDLVVEEALVWEGTG